MKNFTLRDNRVIHFEKSEVMGILNVTPDSFYSGSRALSLSHGIEQARQMVREGALILDVGGESTRPGSNPVTPTEEVERVIPLIQAIREHCGNVLISVDTYHSETARLALKAGADMINDIFGLTFDQHMAHLAAEKEVPIVVMHMKGTPKHMQDNPRYDDVVEEIFQFFRRQIDAALAAGSRRDRLILDPGIGFGKTYQHNLEVLQSIDKFKVFDLPILLAVSRKTFIGSCLGDLPPEERLEGALAVSCFSALHDIEMVRVHDVKENLRALRMTEALKV